MLGGTKAQQSRLEDQAADMAKRVTAKEQRMKELKERLNQTKDFPRAEGSRVVPRKLLKI